MERPDQRSPGDDPASIPRALPGGARTGAAASAARSRCVRAQGALNGAENGLSSSGSKALLRQQSCVPQLVVRLGRDADYVEVDDRPAVRPRHDVDDSFPARRATAGRSPHRTREAARSSAARRTSAAARTRRRRRRRQAPVRIGCASGPSALPGSLPRSTRRWPPRRRRPRTAPRSRSTGSGWHRRCGADRRCSAATPARPGLPERTVPRGPRPR